MPSLTKVSRAVIIAGLAMLLLQWWSGCPTDRYEAKPGYPAASPSGKYRLVVSTGYNGECEFAQFQITTNSKFPRVLYSSADHFRRRDRTYFFWDPQDRAWVYSGDVGTYYWVRGSGSTWQKHHYSRDDYKTGRVPAPDFLRKRNRL
jgi:hypothetical protein